MASRFENNHLDELGPEQGVVLVLSALTRIRVSNSIEHLHELRSIKYRSRTPIMQQWYKEIIDT